MTERTYKKDLDIVNIWFREVLPDDDVESLQPLFHLVESMVQHHGVFLRDLEHRLLLWEGRGDDDTHRVGDILLKNMVVLPVSWKRGVVCKMGFFNLGIFRRFTKSTWNTMRTLSSGCTKCSSTMSASSRPIAISNSRRSATFQSAVWC